MAGSGTPATVALRRAGVAFVVHEFEVGSTGAEGYGLAAARALGVPAERVFKTLVAEVDGEPVLAVVPVAGHVSLKALAAARRAKRAALCPPAEAERLTGYVVGGISPIGGRRRLPVVLDGSAPRWPSVYVSGGRRGLDLELDPHDLVAVLAATVADIATSR